MVLYFVLSCAGLLISIPHIMYLTPMSFSLHRDYWIKLGSEAFLAKSNVSRPAAILSSNTRRYGSLDLLRHCLLLLCGDVQVNPGSLSTKVETLTRNSPVAFAMRVFRGLTKEFVVMIIILGFTRTVSK